uniref:Uncharacterized protein n=1 Tax=Populus trichocarpa TaxID=3694 RepID=A0A2K1Y802_POPTR
MGRYNVNILVCTLNYAHASNFLQELVLNAASAALSCLVLFAGLRKLDLNREASKKALEHKKEIAKHLDRPLIQTNPYEDVIACDQALYELVILHLRKPELFTHKKLLGPQKGVVLKGEKIKSKIDFDCITSLCEGYTGSHLFYIVILSQAPRPLSESDLQGVLGTSTKTTSDDYQVQATTNELSKLIVSQILNLQSDNQDP